MNVEGKANRSDYGSDMRCERKIRIGGASRFFGPNSGKGKVAINPQV